MAIYTKKGDRGKSSVLRSKKRLSKNDFIFEAIGSLDEASAFLGLVASATKDKKLKKLLSTIQSDLMLINAKAAGGILHFTQEKTFFLEKRIDFYQNKLKELKHFILPQGTVTSSYLHIARSIVRRAERKFCPLLQDKIISEEIYAYLNRLSDLLFVLARFENKKVKKAEVIWTVR